MSQQETSSSSSSTAVATGENMSQHGIVGETFTEKFKRKFKAQPWFRSSRLTWRPLVFVSTLFNTHTYYTEVSLLQRVYWQQDWRILGKVDLRACLIE